MTRSRCAPQVLSLAYVTNDLDEGGALINRALQLNPNFAWGWLRGDWVSVWLGQPEVALDHLQRVMRLSPMRRRIGTKGPSLGSARQYSLSRRHKKRTVSGLIPFRARDCAPRRG